MNIRYYTPRFNEVDRGVYWYHLVRLSVCGQNRVRSVSSTILIGSISYLHILSSNFRRCVACNARFKIHLTFWRIFKICNFDFVIFWLGIRYDSMVWVIMRQRGVSSERRRSSCSSYISLFSLSRATKPSNGEWSICFRRHEDRIEAPSYYLNRWLPCSWSL